MKKVIFCENKEEVVKVENVTTLKYYGVLFKETSHRGFVGKMTIGYEYKYTVFAPEGFTDGNNWSAFKSNTLLKFFENIQSYCEAVYEFDTFWELMDWVKKEE